jgi:hypothetical protein
MRLQNINNLPDLSSQSELRLLLCCSKVTIWRAVQRGELKPKRVKGFLLFRTCCNGYDCKK